MAKLHRGIMSRASLFVILFTAASLAAAFLVPAMPQPVAYHDFADHRAILGVANFLDVASNAGFLLAGIAASVVYWLATERAGAGNVIPHGLLQGYAVVMLLLLAVLYRSRYTRGADIYWVFGAYLAAKLSETLDGELLGLGGLVSGHSLKHLAAAFAGFMVCRMLWRRVLDPVASAAFRAPTDRAPRVPPPADSASAP
jgi:hypothetical protein